MGLKKIIQKHQVLKSIANGELTIPGEPMIYSLKYSMGSRTKSVQFFRNSQWKSMLKSYFSSYYNTNTAVVVIVRFYVGYTGTKEVSEKKMKSEKTPAVHGFELCDYLLSFIEMLHKVLINSYKQIVKIESDKFYSNDPRTVFKFMTWDNYVQTRSNKNNDTFNSKAKSIGETREIWSVQS